MSSSAQASSHLKYKERDSRHTNLQVAHPKVIIFSPVSARPEGVVHPRVRRGFGVCRRSVSSWSSHSSYNLQFDKFKTQAGAFRRQAFQVQFCGPAGPTV
jgi:hypothetical protein